MAILERQLRRLRAQKLKRLALARDTTTTCPPPPRCLIEFSEYCRWRDIDDSTTWVTGLQPIPAALYGETECFRFDHEGKPLPGRSIVGKSRKVQVTSGVLNGIAMIMCHVDGFKAATFIHKLTQQIDRSLRVGAFNMFRRLPHEWTGGVKTAGNSCTFLKTGATWSLRTAGSNAEVAEDTGRSDKFDFVHATESQRFKQGDAWWTAVSNAVPRKRGQILIENTFPPNEENWFAAMYFSAKAHQNGFRAHFWPWYAHPRNTLGPGDREYREVMSAEYAEKLEPAILAEEEELGLRPGQRAWRRATYRGSAKQISNAKREHPETDTDPFTYAEGVIDRDALELVKADVRPPLWSHRDVVTNETGIPTVIQYTRRFGQLFCSIWEHNLSERIYMGGDTARIVGPDFQAAHFLTQSDHRQVAEIWGSGRDSDYALATRWVLCMLGADSMQTAALLKPAVAMSDYQPISHRVCPERNHGAQFIEELRAQRLNLYRRRRKAPRERDPRRKLDQYGVSTNRSTRPLIIGLVIDAVEGPHVDRAGNLRAPAPTVIIRSAGLLEELTQLVAIDDKIQARPDAHDDRVIAFGIARFAAGRKKPKEPDRDSTTVTAEPVRMQSAWWTSGPG